MLQAIVFDFDGVIVDSERLHHQALLRAVRPLGIQFDYDYYVKYLIGYDDRDSLRVLLAMQGGNKRPKTPEDFHGDEGQISRLKEDKAQAFEQIVREGVQTIAGAEWFIERIAPRMPMAIASGATRRDIDLVLEHLGLGGRFDLIVSADDVVRSKPDPQSYAQAVRGLAQRHPELGLEPVHCLAIEDTAAGIESARGAGLWTLGLASTGPAGNLRRAHRVVATLEGLEPEQLQQWFG